MKKTARIAGILYLLQIPLGVFGILYISKIVGLPGHNHISVSTILENEFLFRLSIVSAILCALVTMATAVYISKVLSPVNKFYAHLIVVFTMVVAPISLLNELNHVAILLIAKNFPNSAFVPNETSKLLSLFLSLHQYGMQIVGIFFGLWLLPMGYLVMKSKYIPALIGILLVVTCAGYLFDFIIFFLFPTFDITLSEYTWMGEVAMVLWLLIKGVNQKEFEKYYGESANS